MLPALAQREPIGVTGSSFDRIEVFAELGDVWFRIRKSIAVIRPSEEVALTFACIREGNWHVLNARSYGCLWSDYAGRELRVILLSFKQKIFFRQFPWLSSRYSKGLNHLYSWRVSRIVPFSVEPERFAEWHNLLRTDYRINYIMFNPVIDNVSSLHGVESLSVDSIGLNHLLQLSGIDIRNTDRDHEDCQFSDKSVHIKFLPPWRRIITIIGIGMFGWGRWASRENGRHINNARTAFLMIALMLGGVILAVWSV